MRLFELSSYASGDELAAAVAHAWLDEIEGATRAARACSVALSGGRIMLRFFPAVVAQAGARGTSFQDVHFFWADERCVPPESPDSNFGAANRLLFGPLNIAESRIHRIRGEEAPETARQKAEDEIRRIAPPDQGDQPVLSLIFLGMGEDGHVASLFPGAPAEITDSAPAFLTVDHSPKPPPRRISLSYQAIVSAEQVWVLVSGTGKEKAFGESLSPNGQTPLARVIQSRPFTKIFSDLPPPAIS